MEGTDGRRRSRPTLRPVVDPLEDRLLLATLSLWSQEAPLDWPNLVADAHAARMLALDRVEVYGRPLPAALPPEEKLPEPPFPPLDGVTPGLEHEHEDLVIERAELRTARLTTLDTVAAALSESRPVETSPPEPGRHEPRLEREQGSFAASAETARLMSGQALVVVSERASQPSAVAPLLPEDLLPLSLATVRAAVEPLLKSSLTVALGPSTSEPSPLTVLARVVVPLQASLPLDVQVFQRAADAFFARLTDLENELTSKPSPVTVLSCMVVAGAVAFECVRRLKRRQELHPSGGELALEPLDLALEE
jgi:hypothetical protein